MPAAAATAERALLGEALRYAGGRRALGRVVMLQWRGEAVVHAGGNDVAIGVATTLVPFSWVRSKSWRLVDGPEKSRTMLITPEGGWVERGGRTEALAPAFVGHERAQFAIYALMLLAPIAGGRAKLRRLADRGPLRVLEVTHPLAPPTELLFEPSGRLAEALNRVPDSAGGAPIAQRFIFSEEAVTTAPIRWPRGLRIEQEGKPYFELRFDRIETRPF